MKVIAWCLQSDYVKRASMFFVVKCIGSVIEVENNRVTYVLPSYLSGQK